MSQILYYNNVYQTEQICPCFDFKIGKITLFRGKTWGIKREVNNGFRCPRPTIFQKFEAIVNCHNPSASYAINVQNVFNILAVFLLLTILLLLIFQARNLTIYMIFAYPKT